MVQTVVPKGLYSRVNEVIGQPPSFQPIRFSLTRVVLMLAKSSCSLENWGSVGDNSIICGYMGDHNWFRCAPPQPSPRREQHLRNQHVFPTTRTGAKVEVEWICKHRICLHSVEFSEEPLLSYVESFSGSHTAVYGAE